MTEIHGLEKRVGLHPEVFQKANIAGKALPVPDTVKSAKECESRAKMDACTMSSRQSSSKTVLGTSPTVPKWLEQTAKANRVKSAWRTYGKRLSSLSSTGGTILSTP